MKLENFICPKCNQKPTINNAVMIREWSIGSLTLHYFSCGNCRICDYEKRVIRSHISWWRNNDKLKFGAKSYPFKIIYESAIKFLEEIMKYNERIGYRRTRFKYTPRK